MSTKLERYDVLMKGFRYWKRKKSDICVKDSSNEEIINLFFDSRYFPSTIRANCYYTAKCDRISIIRAILDFTKKNVKFRDYFCPSTIEEPAKNGNIELVKSLLQDDRCKKINHAVEALNNVVEAFNLMAENGCLKIVKLLLKIIQHKYYHLPNFASDRQQSHKQQSHKQQSQKVAEFLMKTLDSIMMNKPSKFTIKLWKWRVVLRICHIYNRIVKETGSFENMPFLFNHCGSGWYCIRKC